MKFYVKIIPSIKFSTLVQIVKDLKLKYLIHKNKLILYGEDMSLLIPVSSVAEKFMFYTNYIYSHSKEKWVLIIGPRENTSNKTYKLFNKIFKEVIKKIK